MIVFRKEPNQSHSMMGNHIAGLATPVSGAQQVEMWRGQMDPRSATPPHYHDTEEIVLFLRGNGRAATVGNREVFYQGGDTLILPPLSIHQLFSEMETEFVAALPIGGTVKLPDGTVMDLPWRK